MISFRFVRYRPIINGLGRVEMKCFDSDSALYEIIFFKIEQIQFLTITSTCSISVFLLTLSTLFPNVKFIFQQYFSMLFTVLKKNH